MKKNSRALIIAILIAVALLIAYGKNLNPFGNGEGNAVCEGKTLRNKEITEVFPLGDDQAPIFLEVYSDYQCSHCSSYYAVTIKAAIKDYVDTAKVKLLYRDIAFQGERSQWAAEAARCANDQGKFWEYHDAITIAKYQSNSSAYDKDNLIKTAKGLGLDECEFILCLETGKYAKEIKNNTQEAWAKITGTPTTFLNDEMVADDNGGNLGGMPYEILKSKIEEALEEQIGFADQT